MIKIVKDEDVEVIKGIRGDVKSSSGGNPNGVARTINMTEDVGEQELGGNRAAEPNFFTIMLLARDCLFNSKFDYGVQLQALL